MNEFKPVARIGVTEMLATWEGPAQLEPGVVLAGKSSEFLSMMDDAAALAGWISATAIGCPAGHAAFEGIKSKVREVLAAWRGRYGQAKVDEVKQQLCLQLAQSRNRRKMTEEDLNKRIDLLFAQSKD